MVRVVWIGIPALIASMSLAVLGGGMVDSLVETFWNAIYPSQEKIVGGYTAVDGQFPYQVLLLTVKKSEKSLCGGSVLTSWHVLTAAHCTYGIDHAIMSFGTIHSSRSRARATRLATQRNIVVHPSYDAVNIRNDIAVVFLNRELPTTDFMKAVNLPPFGFINPRYYEGRVGIISGWGLTSDASSSASKYLNFAEVTVMPQSSCRYYYASLNYELSNAQICTAFYGSGTCGGDSGGPLVLREIDGSVTQIGIVSFGTNTCEGGSPSVYTNVAAYVGWIRRMISFRA